MDSSGSVLRRRGDSLDALVADHVISSSIRALKLEFAEEDVGIRFVLPAFEFCRPKKEFLLRRLRRLDASEHEGLEMLALLVWDGAQGSCDCP